MVVYNAKLGIGDIIKTIRLSRRPSFIFRMEVIITSPSIAGSITVNAATCKSISDILRPPLSSIARRIGLCRFFYTMLYLQINLRHIFSHGDVNRNHYYCGMTHAATVSK